MQFVAVSQAYSKDVVKSSSDSARLKVYLERITTVRICLKFQRELFKSVI